MIFLFTDSHIDTAYERYRQYLRQYSKSIADTIRSSINTEILTTLGLLML